MSKNIILHTHKHGTDHYSASTEKEKNASLKEIFQSNKDMECYYNLNKKSVDEEVARLTEETKNCMELRAVFLNHKNDYEIKIMDDRIKTYTEEIKNLSRQHKLYVLANKKDYKAMEELLTLRQDYEYEGFKYSTLK